ncbi:MAG: TIGR01620 family protein [Pseudomonadota bacterium]
MADQDRNTPPRGPVVIEIEDEAARPDPAEAPPVPDGAPPRGQAMQTVAALGARPANRLGRLFWGGAAALFGFVLSVAAWDFVTGLLARNAFLGGAALILVAIVIIAFLAMALREAAGLMRLRRLDMLHRDAEAALAGADLAAARQVVERLEGLYATRADASWGLARLAERKGDMFDADALLGLAEREVLRPLDAQAVKEVEAAARQVAMVTALVPLALADVVAALGANLRMIRRIAEVYGGRSGSLGNWRLTRAVLTHLVATGAVAVGDDMLQSVAGGGILSRLSRRFGEGLVNGALTARVGVAALEVCRPLPFSAERRPSVTRIVQRALAGLFASEKTPEE